MADCKKLLACVVNLGMANATASSEIMISPMYPQTP